MMINACCSGSIEAVRGSILKILFLSSRKAIAAERWAPPRKGPEKINPSKGDKGAFAIGTCGDGIGS